jgi:hypothetical protein
MGNRDINICIHFDNKGLVKGLRKINRRLWWMGGKMFFKKIIVAICAIPRGIIKGYKKYKDIMK